MKNYRVEIQKVKSMANANGLIHAKLDAQVQPAARSDDDAEPSTVLTMSEDTARILMLLLRTQLAEFDGRKAKSRR